MTVLAVLISASDRAGTLSALAQVFAVHAANIGHVDSHGSGGISDIYFEVTTEEARRERILAELAEVPGVIKVEVTPSLTTIYGKRIVILGGGAQVGQVALGAISEADRHNIRGEHISVDTMPLVGEQALATAVRATIRLPRVKLIVLAGSLMGGEITAAIGDVRAQGIFVISLNMAGSVPDAADLVVNDPIQAGVMAVMAVADTASFDIVRQQKRRY
jgi:energy-converting hydrogenase B subunit Q